MLALAPLCSVLILWIWLLGSVGHALPVGRAAAKDAPDYISAAHVLQRGENLYRPHLVWEGKRHMLGLSENTPGKELARVAEPPVLFWAMEPLIGKPVAPASLALVGLFFLAGLIGLVAACAALGWRNPVVPVLVGLALPPMSYYIFIANLGVVVFAGCSAGLLLARRYPFLAGCLLSLAICKPQLALPLAGLIMLFHSSSRLRAIAGLVAGTAVILGASALTAGPRTLLWWLQAFHSFTDTLHVQTLFASLNVLYEPYLPSRVSMLIAAALVVLAGVATLVALRRHWTDGPLDVRNLAWLWLIWFAVAPYDHYYDYIFLAPVVLSFLANTRPGDRVRAFIILYAVTLAGPLETAAAPPHLIGPILLFIVIGAFLIPWPLRRTREVEHAEPVRQYQPSA